MNPTSSGADRIIVALDVNDLSAAGSIIDKLYPAVKMFKIGSQLFTSAGPGAVELVKKERRRRFFGPEIS